MWMYHSAAALNNDVADGIVANAEYSSLFVESESRSGRWQSFCTGEWASVRGDAPEDEIDVQHIRRLRIKGRICYGSFSVGDFRYHRRGAEQMRFVGGGPLG